MSTLSSLEKTIAGWYKNAPHLPKNASAWLSENVWWLALIGVVLSVLGLFAIIPALFATLAFTTYFAGMAGTYAPASYGAISAFSWLSVLITVVGYIATTAILAMAISPLKTKSKKGWTLLFLSFLVNLVVSVASALVVANVFSIIGTFIAAAIGAYFLFEVHSYFGAAHKVHAKTHTKKA